MTIFVHAREMGTKGQLAPYLHVVRILHKKRLPLIHSVVTGHPIRNPFLDRKGTRRLQDVEAMKKVTRKRGMRKSLQAQKPPRFRISGIRGGITTLQVAEVLDLTLRGALVEHHGMFQSHSSGFLQLGASGDLSTIRCRLLQSRVSRNQGGGLCYQTRVEFLELSPAAEEVLRVLIQSSRANGICDGGGP